MNQVKAVICGYYGKGNAGDEALLVSLLQMLPREITPIVLSSNPTHTSSCYGVESRSRNSLTTLWRSLTTSDYFIWGGGSLIQDVSSWRSPYYYLGLMAIAQSLRLSTIAWAQGIGPIQHPLTLNFTRRILAGCSRISVRDRASAQLLKQWGIPHTLAPDPVWALNAMPVQDMNLPSSSSAIVAVNFRSHSLLTPERLRTLTQALVSFQAITSASFVFIPFQLSQDLAICEQIASQLSSSIITVENPQQLKSLFAGISMLIGMRLHSLIMAASEGCRCFALSYDPKVSYLMEDTHMYGLKLQDLPENPEVITSNWLECYQQPSSLDNKMIQSLVSQAQKHQQLLF